MSADANKRLPLYLEIFGFLLVPLPAGLIASILLWEPDGILISLTIGVVATIIFAVPAYALLHRYTVVNLASCGAGGMICGAAYGLMFWLWINYFKANGADHATAYPIIIIALFAVAGLCGLLSGFTFWPCAVARSGCRRNPPISRSR